MHHGGTQIMQQNINQDDFNLGRHGICVEIADRYIRNFNPYSSSATFLVLSLKLLLFFIHVLFIVIYNAPGFYMEKRIINNSIFLVTIFSAPVIDRNTRLYTQLQGRSERKSRLNINMHSGEFKTSCRNQVVSRACWI